MIVFFLTCTISFNMEFNGDVEKTMGLQQKCDGTLSSKCPLVTERNGIYTIAFSDGDTIMVPADQCTISYIRSKK